MGAINNPTPPYLCPAWRIFLTGDLAGLPVDVALWLERRGYVEPFPTTEDCQGFVPVMFRRNWSKGFYDISERESEITRKADDEL